jgi:ubiquinone/menaquinone biosynthesis C-methylase UbiE
VASSENQVHHPIFARIYLRISAQADERGGAEHRDKLLAGLSGRVIEVGAGNGGNFAHYPPEVVEVLAVEPESLLRENAEEAARDAPVKITVVDGLADALPAEDGTFDAAIASLVLCSVPDQAHALGEIHRVLRPGGELRFYEHVVSRKPMMARMQRFADATFYPHISGGCHAARDTGAAIEAAGFEVETLERFAFKPGALAPSIPHILGRARRGESVQAGSPG